MASIKSGGAAFPHLEEFRERARERDLFTKLVMVLIASLAILAVIAFFYAASAILGFVADVIGSQLQAWADSVSDPN